MRTKIILLAAVLVLSAGTLFWFYPKGSATGYQPEERQYPVAAMPPPLASLQEINSAFWYATLHGHLQQAKELLARGADINTQNKTGLTILVLVLDKSPASDDISNFLLDNGADVNAVPQSQKGTTVLCGAASASTKILRRILKSGARVNVHNPQALSALWVAAASRKTENVRLLLAHGADPTYRVASSGLSVLDIAEKKWDRESAALIRKAISQWEKKGKQKRSAL